LGARPRFTLQAQRYFAVALKLWWLTFTQAGAKAHWVFAPSLLKRHNACLPDRQAKSSQGLSASIVGAAFQLSSGKYFTYF